MTARKQSKAGRRQAGSAAAPASGIGTVPAERVFEHADVVLFCLAVEPRGVFRFLAVNRAFLRSTGLNKSQVVGKRMQEVVPHASQDMVLKNYRRAVRGRKTVKWIACSQYAIGLKHGEVSITPVLDTRGKVVQLAGMVHDITTRMETETALRESEERYRLLADHTDNIVSLMDTHGNSLYISPSFFRKTGWTQKDLQRRNWRTRVHPADLSLVEHARNANLAGKATEIEYRMLCRDGSELWMETKCKPIQDASGNAWRMVVWSHDITRYKLAEERIKQEQEFNQVLVNHASMLLVILDAKARILHVNETTAAGLGRRREALLGLTPWEIGLMDDQEIERSKKRFRNLLRGGATAPVEVRLRTKGGEHRNVELRTTATRKTDGSIDRVIVVATDLTERLRLQQEVLRVSEQEHARIGSDLHDGVGQTMTGVASLVDALEEELDGEAQKSAHRIRQLLQEAIQDVRRLSHGLSPAAVRHRELGGALQLLAETIRTNFRTDCACQIAGDIDLADPDKQMHLFRIAQEAVNNALRHSKPKQMKLSLRRHGKGTCELKIENNGRGMAKDQHGSDGIGLRVMEYRANLIGGSLQVQNGRRGGVAVTCRFPCQG